MSLDQVRPFVINNVTHNHYTMHAGPNAMIGGPSFGGNVANKLSPQGEVTVNIEGDASAGGGMQFGGQGNNAGGAGASNAGASPRTTQAKSWWERYKMHTLILGVLALAGTALKIFYGK